MQKKFIAIIGNPLEHTLSPFIHNHAFAITKLPYTYGIIKTTTEFLPNVVSSLRNKNFRGANITIPFKEKIIPFVDVISDEAKIIGAINTIVNNNGTLHGYNTDVDGIISSLEKYKKELHRSTVLIVGSGGAAKSVIYALCQYFSPKKIYLYNRSIEKAKSIELYFQSLFPKTSLQTLSRFPDDVQRINLIINTTPVGMKPLVDKMPIPSNLVLSNKQIIFDIIYNPLQTPLLHYAQKSGAIIINGLEMFLQQAAKSFQLWTNTVFPKEEIYFSLVQKFTHISF